LGIEEILKKNDDKRAKGNVRQGAYERGLLARALFSETVASALIAGIVSLKDRAIGVPVRLPIASKPTESGVYIESEGLVRFTMHCVIRADPNGVAYCSPIDMAMSRGGRTARLVFDPVRGAAGHRLGKLGVAEKQFFVEPAKLQRALELLAHQI
jgi:hypothetical protein